MIFKSLAAVWLASGTVSAFAQGTQLSAAIALGKVGERYDGYMGFSAAPSDEVRRAVLGINIERRSLYTELATQRGVTAQLVGIATACTLLRQLPVGEAYMLKEGVWKRRAVGETVPLPDYCR